MTTLTPTRRAVEPVPPVGVHRTPRHLYYFNGQGPWPSVTTITGVLDKPALTRWHREQVARAAVEHADRLAADRLAGNEEAAVAFLLAVRTEGTNGRERGTRIHDALESVSAASRLKSIPRRAGHRRGRRLAQRAPLPAARNRGVPHQRSARLWRNVRPRRRD